MGQLLTKLTHLYTRTGATGFEPATSGLTGRRANRCTTPPRANGIVSKLYNCVNNLVGYFYNSPLTPFPRHLILNRRIEKGVK